MKYHRPYNRDLTTSASVTNHNDPLYDEVYFRSMLMLERKRTERTKRPFMLMLVDIAGLHQTENSQRTLKKLVHSIMSVSRETDIKGWFSKGKVVGIVFLDCDHSFADTVPDKVQRSFRELLTPVQNSMVSISYFMFPDAGNVSGNRSVDLNAILYESKTGTVVARNFPLLCKRGIDIVGSIIGIICFFPFLLIIPLLIRCTSRGPAFFKQERVGRYGKKFTLIKFRTMKASNSTAIHRDFIKQFIKNSADAAKAERPMEFKIKNDPRITRIGKFLRKTSLDEVPQFLNVLWGDMSLVGPRPAIPYEVDEYDIWHRRRVLEVKPGITGVWQVEGRSRTDFNSMVRMDINYIQNWSPVMDLELMLKTPLALVSAKGAY